MFTVRTSRYTYTFTKNISLSAGTKTNVTLDFANPDVQPTRKVGVLGDSISTFDGTMCNDEYSPFYPGSDPNVGTNPDKAVDCKEKTYWWRVIYERMQQEGFQMTYNDLYYGDHAIKNAVVNFSGYCSGVVVSPDGLVFTNHHCGFEAIRSHSTVEHDYMLNGFYAKTYEEELPNKNMFVSFMIDQNDITDQVMKLGYENKSRDQRAQLLDSLENAMSKRVKAEDPTLRQLDVAPSDLRLLGVPHLCRPEDQRSCCLQQGQCALPPQALGSCVDAGI